jgi:hypothetical protein
MKKILHPLSVILLSALLLVSCGAKNTAKDVATTWLNSFFHMDYEAAKKVSTEDTKALLTQLSALTAMMPDSSKNEMKKAVITIKEVKENGDTAMVTYTVSDGGKDASKDQPPLKLVKSNTGDTKGKWLVSFTKNDNMGGGADASPASPADTTGAPPAPADAPPADTAKH